MLESPLHPDKWSSKFLPDQAYSLQAVLLQQTKDSGQDPSRDSVRCVGRWEDAMGKNGSTYTY